MEKNKEMFTGVESAQLLKISRTSFWRMRDNGQIAPSIEINGKPYFTMDDLAKAIEKPKKP